MRLNWSDEPIFPHEEAQENVTLLEEILDRLVTGDVGYVSDELAWRLDSGMASGMYSFSKETTDYFTNNVLRSNGNYWGTGRITGRIDELRPFVDSILAWENNGGKDALISEARKLLAGQKERLGMLAAEEANYLRAVDEK